MFKVESSNIFTVPVITIHCDQLNKLIMYTQRVNSLNIRLNSNQTYAKVISAKYMQLQHKRQNRTPSKDNGFIKQIMKRQRYKPESALFLGYFLLYQYTPEKCTRHQEWKTHILTQQTTLYKQSHVTAKKCQLTSLFNRFI